MANPQQWCFSYLSQFARLRMRIALWRDIIAKAGIQAV
jgi:hypothetical protein